MCTAIYALSRSWGRDALRVGVADARVGGGRKHGRPLGVGSEGTLMDDLGAPGSALPPGVKPEDETPATPKIRYNFTFTQFKVLPC